MGLILSLIMYLEVETRYKFPNQTASKHKALHGFSFRSAYVEKKMLLDPVDNCDLPFQCICEELEAARRLVHHQ